MLIMLIMLNPPPDFPKSPKYELTLLTLLTFPLPEAFFYREELTLLTFLAFWLYCRLAIARNLSKNRVFELILYRLDAITGGRDVFRHKRQPKKANFGTRNCVPKNGPFFRPDTGGRAFWVGKGR